MKTLTHQQVNQIYDSIPQDTIKGRRDLALLYVAFTTGLRTAELGNLSLNHIKPHGDHYLITVQRKRDNGLIPTLDQTGYDLIQKYVAAYNEPLDDDDPRRITGDIPIWQPLDNRSQHLDIARNGYDPKTRLTSGAIIKLVRARTMPAVGLSLSVEDIRATYATLAYQDGAEMATICRNLGIKTRRVSRIGLYLGTVSHTYDESIISRKKRFAGINDEAYQEQTS